MSRDQSEIRVAL